MCRDGFLNCSIAFSCEFDFTCFCLLNYLTIIKTLPETLFRDFETVTLTLKMITGTRLWSKRCLGHVPSIHLRGFFLYLMRCGHCRNSTNHREGIRYRNQVAALETILITNKGFYQCCGSMTFLCGSRSGSADPCL